MNEVATLFTRQLDSNDNDFAMSIEQSNETLSIFMAILTFVGSSMVILTGLVFPGVVMNKTLSFTIMLVSFNNWINGLGIMLGLSIGTRCTVQGFLTMFGVKGSWFTVAIVCHQLRRTITNTGKLSFTTKQKIYICI
jgi:hypothetical protein